MTGPPAVLVLEDGRVLRGSGFGAPGTSFGEMVFNTAMTGYQETLTDPSYHRQIVAMTAPHIGNTGINDEDHESRRIWVAGYVVREPARLASSWRARRSLDDELRAQGVTCIAVAGTRALTRHLRSAGAMRAAVSTAAADVAQPDGLLERVLASPSMTGADLPREVTTPAPYVVRPPRGTPTTYRVAAVDLGIKAATPRRMAALGCEVRVLPATATAAQILAIEPDGVFFSNGPGDPAAVGYAVEAMRGLLDRRVPVFGICLGSQILGRALGLGTYKLLFGHRGVNQPVADLATGRVHITSHNHGFAVAPPRGAQPPPHSWGTRANPDENSGPHMTSVTGVTGVTGEAGAEATTGIVAAGSGADGATLDCSAGAGDVAVAGVARLAQPFGTSYGSAVVTHVCLNDGVVEGLRLLDRPAFGVQYHPEAAPGPHDAAGEFDRFCALMDGSR